MFIFSALESSASYSVAEYLAISYPTLLLWRNGTNRVVKSLEINKALLHHQPIRPIDLIYSRILLEFSSATATFAILYVIFLALGICHMPHDPLKFGLGYLLVLWFSLGFVLIMSALSDMSDAAERLSHVILYLMLPFTGVFLPLFTVPPPYRNLLLLFPLVDAVEYMHSGYYGPRMPTYYHLSYTVIVLAAMLLFGYSLTNIAIRRTLSR
jgi:capsular polysaccharide transport system permease protein